MNPTLSERQSYSIYILILAACAMSFPTKRLARVACDLDQQVICRPSLTYIYIYIIYNSELSCLHSGELGPGAFTVCVEQARFVCA